MLARTVLMYDLGEVLLTHTTLTRDEHREVCGSHLHGNINGTIQLISITDDTKSQLYLLYFLTIHKPTQSI